DRRHRAGGHAHVDVRAAVVPLEYRGLAAGGGAVLLRGLQPADGGGAGRGDADVALARDVEGRRDAGAESRVVGRRRADAVLGVVFVVADAEVERQAVVQLPPVVHESGVRPRVRALCEGVDRRVVDDRVRTEGRVDVAVVETRGGREETGGAARLVAGCRGLAVEV